MLVDVVELNVREAARAREDVMSTVPVRGVLRMDRLWTDRELENAPAHADICPMTLETLYSARVLYWRGVNLLLVGWQRQPMPGGKSGRRFRQRWWVRLVLDPSLPPMSAVERRARRVSASEAAREP